MEKPAGSRLSYAWNKRPAYGITGDLDTASGATLSKAAPCTACLGQGAPSTVRCAPVQPCAQHSPCAHLLERCSRGHRDNSPPWVPGYLYDSSCSGGVSSAGTASAFQLRSVLGWSQSPRASCRRAVCSRTASSSCAATVSDAVLFDEDRHTSKCAALVQIWCTRV